MTVQTYKVGPGTLKLGETGSEQDFSCQLTSCKVTPSVDSEDDIDVLCGEIEAGEDTFTWTLNGTMLQDLGVLTAWLLTNKGTKQPFTYVPNTAKGKQITGIIKVRPIEIGGDVKSKPTSDFELPVVGDIAFGDVPEV